MVEKLKTTVPSDKAKKPTEVLRTRRGGVPRELIEKNRRQKAIRKNIVAALQNGAQTIPDLARIVAMPADEVLWHVMSMKKYGKICETEQVDGYFRYALVSESPKTEHPS